MPDFARLRLLRGAAIVPVLIFAGLILSACGVLDRGMFWALTGESPAGAVKKGAEDAARTQSPPEGPILGSAEPAAPKEGKGHDDRRAALLVIPFDQPRADTRQALSDLVGPILARDPEASFELVAVTPGAPEPAHAESASRESRHAAEGVLIALVAAGLAAERVGLSARSDPEITRSELRLYRR